MRKAAAPTASGDSNTVDWRSSDSGKCVRKERWARGSIIFLLVTEMLFVATWALCLYEGKTWGNEGYPNSGLGLVLFEFAHVAFAALFLIGACGLATLPFGWNKLNYRQLVLVSVCGLGTFTLVGLVLGLLGLLTVPVLLPIVCLGLWGSVRQGVQSFDWNRIWVAVASRRTMWVLVALVPLAMLLAMKGLYPGGGHDYWNHYLPYGLHVADTGSLAPNVWWYHYFTSKGLVLITAPLALTAGNATIAPLVVLGLVGVTGLLLSCALPRSRWTALSVAGFFVMFCLTPGPEGILRDHGGWGEFGKGHEVAAVFVAAIVVMVVHGARFFESSKARLWIAALLILALSVVATPSAVLVIAGLCAFAPVAWLMRRSLTPVIYLGLFVAGTFLTGLLNYLTTGVASDLAVGSSMLDGKSAVPFNAAHADSLGWTTNLWLQASETKREAGIGNFLNNLTGQWVYIAQCWRLEYVGYALAISVVLLMGLTAVTRIYKPAQLTTPSVVDRREIRFGLAAMAAVAMGVTLLFCLLVSNDSDHISTYRGMSSLLCIPFLALCYLVTALDLRTRIPGLASGLLGSLRRIRTYIPVLVAFGLVFGCVGVWQSTNGVGALRDSLVHALGGTSTSAALQQQTGLPGRVPPGRGIEPTTRNLMGLVPADGVVATFNVHAYNGLDVSQLRYAGPTTTCWMQNMLAIESADPKAGAALLERYGPRYLLINPHLGIQPFDQTLLAAPVMSNEALRKYWRVVGSDNGTLLLRVVPAGDAGLDAGEVQQLSELRTATPTQVQETLSEYRRFREANGLDPAPQLIPCE